MGLDISFYKQRKGDYNDSHEEVGYFRKVNFIVRYFNLGEDDDGRDIELRKDVFSKFVNDLKVELESRTELQGEPVNKDLMPIRVFFGGSTECDSYYWEDVKFVYAWADSLLREFDWENNVLLLNCWW